MVLSALRVRGGREAIRSVKGIQPGGVEVDLEALARVNLVHTAFLDHLFVTSDFQMNVSD